MDDRNCPDPFHTDNDAPRVEYQVKELPTGLSMTGYACPTCDFRTVETGTFVPTEKACRECGAMFLGLPDVEERCDECFANALAVYVANGGI